MPTKAYKRLLKNMETVNRLTDTYDQIREARGSKGRAAFDHITRSAIVFLASSFEVYIEDVVKECCNKHISLSRDAKKLPGVVKGTLNKYVKNERNSIPPTDLCDEGWRNVYRTIASKRTEKLNTPKVAQISDLFEDLVGIKKNSIKNINQMDKLDSVITFRGEIAHRVKADSYVKIEQVEANKEIISNISVNIDKKIIQYYKKTYPGIRLPWYDSY